MAEHRVVSHEDWLKASLDLLAVEAFTRLVPNGRDEDGFGFIAAIPS